MPPVPPLPPSDGPLSLTDSQELFAALDPRCLEKRDRAGSVWLEASASVRFALRSPLPGRQGESFLAAWARTGLGDKRRRDSLEWRVPEKLLATATAEVLAHTAGPEGLAAGEWFWLHCMASRAIAPDAMEAGRWRLEAVWGADELLARLLKVRASLPQTSRAVQTAFAKAWNQEWRLAYGPSPDRCRDRARLVAFWNQTCQAGPGLPPLAPDPEWLEAALCHHTEHWLNAEAGFRASCGMADRWTSVQEDDHPTAVRQVRVLLDAVRYPRKPVPEVVIGEWEKGSPDVANFLRFRSAVAREEELGEALPPANRSGARRARM